MSQVMSAPEIIQRYFALASTPETEAYLALFADDAVVEDEGRVHVGVDAIRAWRAEVPLVTYQITDVEQTPAGLVMRCRQVTRWPVG